MKRVKLKSPRVVQGTVSRVQFPLVQASQVPVAVRSAPSSRCPLCRTRVGTTEVAIGVMVVRVCEPCSDPVFKTIDALAALSKFFL